MCPRCLGAPSVRPIDGRPLKTVQVDDCELEVVDRFCYLGDMLSAGGGCMAAAIARCKSAWGKFRQLLPLLTVCSICFKTKGRVFNSCVRSAMLHASETWPMSTAALHRLRRNERAMIRWICGVKIDEVNTALLYVKLDIQDLDTVIRERRLRWFGHVVRSSSEINGVRDRVVEGKRGQGRPKKTWNECVQGDLKACGLSEESAYDRVAWRSAIRRCRLEPTPLVGSAPLSTAPPTHGRCTRSSINKTNRI